MTIDLNAEANNIPASESQLRNKIAKGDIKSKYDLAVKLVAEQSQSKEALILLHEVSTDPNIPIELQRRSFLLLGDIAVGKKSYMAAEEYYKNALDLGEMQAVKAIVNLYEAGNLQRKTILDDNDWLYKEDIKRAQSFGSELNTIRDNLKEIRMPVSGDKPHLKKERITPKVKKPSGKQL